MKKLSLWIIPSLFILFIQVSSGQSAPLYFAQHPALNPDGSVIYFSYHGDIWKVKSKGGTAERITAMDGDETHPQVSPDGKWLAFSSNQFGNKDVYIVPIHGGEIKQLTFHEADDVVSSWDWDSQTVYFTSNRSNRVSTYKVNIAGDTPERIFEHYFNTIHNLFPDPINGNLYFNYSWESYNYATRRGYKGPYNPDIQSYNPITKTYKRYTDWEGKDFGVSIDKNGNIYFVSDEENGQLNLYTFRNEEKTALTHFDEMVLNPSVNSDGGKIVFEKGYELWIYFVDEGLAKRVPITGYKNNTLEREKHYSVKGHITSFDVSDDDKKLAFISQGRLFVSDIKGKFIKELPTELSERVLEVYWLNDNKTLLYSQTYKGYTNWYKQKADGSGEEKQLTYDLQNNRLLRCDPQKEKAVYLRGRNEVCIMSLKTFQSEVIAEDELWGFQNDSPQFSPDGKYIVFTARRNFETDIMLCRLSDKKVFNLTQTGVSETSPFFSTDGKYLYFISDRYRPAYPYGLKDPHLYRIALSRIEKPFRSSQFDSLFVRERKDSSDEKKPITKKKQKKKIVEVKIDFQDIMGRIEQVGSHFGQQRDVYALQSKDKQIILYTSNHEKGKYHIWQLEQKAFEKDKTYQISTPSTRNLRIKASEKNHYALIKGNIYTVETASHKATKIEISDYAFVKNLDQTFRQMFYEVWANMEENFYNETFHGADWEAILERYETYLPYLSSRDDLRRLLQDMLGELNTSHYGFRSSGDEEKTYYRTYTAETGLRFTSADPYIVKDVIPLSPISYPDKDILPGDKLVAVNGKRIEPKQNREAYFAFPQRPHELIMTFQRNEKEHQVKVHPTSYAALKTYLYDEWIADKAEIVDKKGKKRIGYVYMKNMTGGALNKFMEDMVSDSCNRDGLILDLRYNTGGNVHDKVLQFLSQRPYLQWKYREGALSSQPDFAPAAKPIVLLINQQTLSDGEMTTVGFQALNLGTVVGTGTYRWIIFTSGKSLVDGSFYRLPSWGVYTLDGKNLETIGATPDIYVDNTFTDRLEGNDPQLDKAIEIILEKLGDTED